MADASITEQILAGAKTALLGTAPGYATPAQDRVERSYKQLISRDQCPMIVITPSIEPTEPMADMVDKSMFEFDVEISTRSDDPFDSAADPVKVAAHQALMAWAETSPLFSFFRRIGTTWQAQEADLTAGVTTLKYRVIYLADASDLSKAPIG